ncbi:MAG TPA: GMC family oxidoreductase [Candidatus Binatia bacterium]|nr:GMC family oxidoreductase [Candidatus Binatia bacterium]
MILDSSTVHGDVTLAADVCVVGSGAGGSVAAAELARGGKSVVLLEEGHYWTSDDFTQREEEMYPRLYRERGTKPTADYAVLVSQGRALGGSTLVSFCLCFRTPHQILAHWTERFGLAELSHESMFPYFERVEQQIGVKDMGPEQANANNRVLIRGAERLGFRGRFMRHNRTDCLGCGYCVIGCAYDRKGDALTTYLAAASKAGARILPDVHVDTVWHERGAVAGVLGRFARPKSSKRFALRVRAPLVVLAAGALESPMLWVRSRLPDPHRLAGRNLHLHPHVVVAGVFDDTIAFWQGIPQSYVVDEFLNLDKSIDGGHLTVAAAAQPVGAAALFPGLGHDHRRLMDAYARTAAVACFLHDRSSGQVTADARGQAVIDYRLNDEDKHDVMNAMRRSCEILFAAGAKSVILPYNDLVEIHQRSGIKVIEERGILANDPLFLSFHPQGTLPMGRDPRVSMVDSFGAAHGIKGLYVADASVFPTSVAVPPQITVMALAARTAEAILRA